MTLSALAVEAAVDPVTHDAWFRTKVLEALNDRTPGVSHEKVEAHFRRRRAATLAAVAAAARLRWP